METRNSLLIYRLKHYGEKLPDIKTNLQNREKQLFKPVLRIFHNTSTLNEILPVISKYVSQKREANANTLYAFLYRIIKNLIEKEDNFELESKVIWETISDPEALPWLIVCWTSLTANASFAGARLCATNNIQRKGRHRREGRRGACNLQSTAWCVMTGQELYGCSVYLQLLEG